MRFQTEIKPSPIRAGKRSTNMLNVPGHTVMLKAFRMIQWMKAELE